MFWTKFSELCHTRGEAPNAVAAKVGVKSTGTVSGWKKGAMPRDGVLAALAAYFDVPVSYFFENKKEPAPLSENELDYDKWLNSLSQDELLKVIAKATQALQERNK